jgi:pimeloyl-ACP methyl ester carboxylesterase
VSDEPDALNVAAGAVTLSGERAGEGAAIVLLHGLTATRRYVVMGSRAIERSGHTMISYDARGHGRSSPAADRVYDYEHLVTDLLAVLDAAGIEQAVLAGASMGAHTAARFTLEHPERVAALALITPAYEPSSTGESQFARWDALARGLREGGVDGFIGAYDLDAVPAAWRETVETVLRQRLSAHEHPSAVADALEAVPRSRPFEDMAELERIAVPTLVVASRDEADPEHPLAVGERYAARIPHASLLVEETGVGGRPARSPIAWQGGQLSKLLIELVDDAHRSM